MAVTNSANIVAVLGGTGSGKGAYIKSELQRLNPDRLVIFDPMGEYSDFVTLHQSLLPISSAMTKQNFRVGFRYPSADEIRKGAKQLSRDNAIKIFSKICKDAYVNGNLVLVIDELSLVTDAKEAPDEWRDCTGRGRHQGLMIYGASQRPARIDKDFFSNATKVRTGRLNFAADVTTMANVLNVSKQAINSLEPLEFLEKDTSNGKIKHGYMQISKGLKPRFTVKYDDSHPAINKILK